MERQPVKSKGIKSVAYDAATRTLLVEYPSARIYKYYDVPSEVYEWLTRVDSKGKFVNRLVKGKYRYEQIDAADRAAGADDLVSLLRGSLNEPPGGSAGS